MSHSNLLPFHGTCPCNFHNAYPGAFHLVSPHFQPRNAPELFAQGPLTWSSIPEQQQRGRWYDVVPIHSDPGQPSLFDSSLLPAWNHHPTETAHKFIHAPHQAVHATQATLRQYSGETRVMHTSHQVASGCASHRKHTKPPSLLPPFRT